MNTAILRLRGGRDSGSDSRSFECAWLETTDVSALSSRERHILRVLIKAELLLKNQLRALSFSSEGAEYMEAGDTLADHDCEYFLNEAVTLVAKDYCQSFLAQVGAFSEHAAGSFSFTRSEGLDICTREFGRHQA